MSVRGQKHFFPGIWQNRGQMQSKREQKRFFRIFPLPYRYLYTVRALCVYTHTHVIYIGVLVVVDCGFLPLLTMMMYTHPVSSTSQFLVFLPILPLSYVGVTQSIDITRISAINILPGILIYLVKTVFSNATIVIPDAQNLSCGDNELWSWF